MRAIASQNRVSHETIRRHRPHVPKRLLAVVEKAEVLRAESIVDRVRALEADARRIATKAETDGDLRCSVAALKTVLDILSKVAELVAKADVAAEDILESPDWRRIEDTLTEAITPYPQAAEAVGRALQGLRG